MRVPDLGRKEPPALDAPMGEDWSLCEEERVCLLATLILFWLRFRFMSLNELWLVFVMALVCLGAGGLAWMALLIFWSARYLVSNSTLSSEISSFLLTARYKSFIAWKKPSIFLQSSSSSEARSSLSVLTLSCLRIGLTMSWAEEPEGLVVLVFL